MAKGYRICKVCNCEYEYCHTEVPVGVNRWQDVACCPEHAAIYFERVAKSRGEYVEPTKKNAPVDVDQKDIVEEGIAFDDDSEGEFEIGFDDEEDEEDL